MRRVIKPLCYAFMLCIVLFQVVMPAAHADNCLHYLDGQSKPVKSLYGRWVLVNYWATWCNYCIDEIPALNRFYARHKADNVTVLAVNYESLSPAKQRELVKEYNISYPSLAVDPAEAMHLGDIRGLPVSFLFNPQGRLVKVFYGPQTDQSLSKALPRHE